jgi:Uma2 family endonuclease
MEKVISPPVKSQRPRRKSQPVLPTPSRIPPLNNGDRLSRPEFERRYAARPDIKKAELIEGVVYLMPSPVRIGQHSEPHSWIMGWLFNYMVATPGTRLGDNATLLLDLDNETQPDAVLWIDEKLGGRAKVNKDDYLEGVPELVVEVAASTAAYDLHDKLNVYRRNGIQEYLVFVSYEAEVRWHVLRDGRYELLAADERGLLRSEVFPGLWLQPEHFWQGDGAALMAVLQEGLASPEHAAFVNRLQEVITP